MLEEENSVVTVVWISGFVCYEILPEANNSARTSEFFVRKIY